MVRTAVTHPSCQPTTECRTELVTGWLTMTVLLMGVTIRALAMD